MALSAGLDTANLAGNAKGAFRMGRPVGFRESLSFRPMTIDQPTAPIARWDISSALGPGGTVQRQCESRTQSALNAVR